MRHIRRPGISCPLHGKKNLGNRKSIGNCCLFMTTNGGHISMGIRGDPVNAKQGSGGGGRPVGAPFGVNKGAGVPGLFQSHQAWTDDRGQPFFVRRLISRPLVFLQNLWVSMVICKPSTGSSSVAPIIFMTATAVPSCEMVSTKLESNGRAERIRVEKVGGFILKCTGIHSYQNP